MGKLYIHVHRHTVRGGEGEVHPTTGHEGPPV